MYHIVYLTTNLINNKIYVGVHSTWNLDDGYLGTGQNIKRAIKKYGKVNFKRHILFYCLYEQDAYKLESCIVDVEFINRRNTYNIKLGGSNPYICETTRNKQSNAAIKRTKSPEQIKKMWETRRKNKDPKRSSTRASKGEATKRNQRHELFKDVISIMFYQWYYNLPYLFKQISGVGCKKYYNSELDKQISLMPNDIIPEGYILGIKPRTTEHIEKLTKNLRKYTAKRKS